MARDIEDDLLAALGLVVVRWAYVEQLVSELFVLLTGGLPGVMPIVTANISNRSLVEWTRTLMDIRYESEDWEIDKDARDALSDVDDIRDKRNALVHGLWSTDCPPGSVIVQTVRLERKDIIRDEVVTAADLADLIDSINDIAVRLRDVLQRARGET